MLCIISAAFNRLAFDIVVCETDCVIINIAAVDVVAVDIKAVDVAAVNVVAVNVEAVDVVAVDVVAVDVVAVDVVALDVAAIDVVAIDVAFNCQAKPPPFADEELFSVSVDEYEHPFPELLSFIEKPVGEGLREGDALDEGVSGVGFEVVWHVNQPFVHQKEYGISSIQ